MSLLLLGVSGTETAIVPEDFFLLLEDGFYLLLESGDKLILE